MNYNSNLTELYVSTSVVILVCIPYSHKKLNGGEKDVVGLV